MEYSTDDQSFYHNFLDMTKAEEKVRKAFSDLLYTISTMDEDRVDKISEFLHNHCNGFGTALQEIFKTKKEWLSLFEEEAVQIPNGITVTAKWVDTFFIDNAVIGLMAETIFQMKLPDNTIEFDPVRMSVIFKVDGEKVLITHWHVSSPLGEANDEIFPGSKEPRRYEDVSVLFTDFVGFTNTASIIPAKKLISELNELFARFDEITQKNGITKIKTIGDSYMAIAGLKQSADHAIKAVKTAIEMLHYLDQRNGLSALQWNIRAGIHSGSVVGGVIGRDKLQFDVWGDTVNVASRFESASEQGRINVSAYTYDLIKDQFPCNYRGGINVKGKGEIEMYFVA